ncbi:serine/threonine protein kinase [Microbacterium sediminis]|nr:serine/threonine protein kinase [Microbacterium sediminis]
MASVYRAVDVMLGRSVAIKMVRAGLEGASLRSARSETAVLASLSHPSLVTLFDAHVEPGRPEYLVMELVDGPTLGERLRQGPLTSRETALLGAELADALHVVHEAGIVHRDVKPSNVLLAPSSSPSRGFRAKLADFGVAFLLGEARVTSPGMVIGTLGYLAPEQLRGEAPSPASDVYSLGLVLLEALTGTRVFPAHGGAEALAARHAGPVEIPPGVPAEWATLLRRMTADDAAERPSALEVAQQAEELAARRDLAVTPTATLPYPEATTAVIAPSAEAPRPLRTGPGGRRRAAAVLAGLAAVTAIGAGVWIGAEGSQAPAATRLKGVVERPVTTVEEPAVITPEVTDEQPGGATDPVVTTPQDDKAAEKAAEEARKTDEKAAEEARKAAEEAQKAADKKAEEAQKQGKEAQKKGD